MISRILNPFIRKFVLLALCAGALAGCASTGHHAARKGQPGSKDPDGSRVVFLTLLDNQWNDPQDMDDTVHRGKGPHLRNPPENEPVMPQKISLVDVKNSRGQSVGSAVLPVYFGDLLLEDLRHKLSAAGYTVRVVRELPGGAGRGIGISLSPLDLAQTSGLLMLQGSCRYRVKADTWHNGSKLASHEYAAQLSDYALVNRSQLLVKIMKLAAEQVSAQSVSDLAKDLAAPPTSR